MIKWWEILVRAIRAFHARLFAESVNPFIAAGWRIPFRAFFVVDPKFRIDRSARSKKAQEQIDLFFIGARRAFAERQFRRFRGTANFAHFCKQSLPASFQLMKLRLNFFDAIGGGFHQSHFYAASNYGSEYQVDRPPPWRTRRPFSTSDVKVALSVFGLAPASRTMSRVVTRPWSRT